MDNHPMLPDRHCRACRSASLQSLGRLPTASVFAGQPLVPPWPGGSLLRCRACRLGQRHPLQDEGDYARLYATAAADVWVSTGLRADQTRVLQAILDARGGAQVLDVGCYDGALLDALPPGYERYGIEPSAAAAQRARGRGVNVLGASLDALAAGSAALPGDGFDLITAVDVIEHVADPADTLARMAALLAPGGLLLVSTGNLDAAAWRWAGARYWYCSFPEHISFASEPWARQVAPRCGLELTAFQPFRYYGDGSGRPAWKSRFRFGREWLRTRAAEAFSRVLSRPAGPRTAERVLGSQGVFEDHVLMHFRRLP